MTAIPTYKLYGEGGEWPTPELLHHESIAERSAIHNWKIRPHRHHDLFQILYILGGCASIRLDGHEEDAVPPCLVLVPPVCVHGFIFSEDIDGHVVTLPDFALERFFNAAVDLGQRLNCPHILNSLSAEDAGHLDTVFHALAEDFTSDRPARLLALEALVGLVLVRAVRLTEAGYLEDGALTDRTARHLRRFLELVARHYRQWFSIEEYASELGITSTRLNYICRQKTGRTALQLVHDRVLLEAKRNLIYTAMTVSEIAYSLGFGDPAYFSRFFTKRVGCPPSAFRKNRAGQL
ncbi:MAG: helix-turn-helix domain-containing protein [Gammaproteobacteria bacterium]